jgi:hypothetical protein
MIGLASGSAHNQDYNELTNSIPGGLKNRNYVGSIKKLTEEIGLDSYSIGNLTIGPETDLCEGSSPLYSMRCFLKLNKFLDVSKSLNS